MPSRRRHRPVLLTNYEEVAGWGETIAEVIEDNRMPPWHADPKHGQFANDRSLTDEEKQLIYQWVADGSPEGDPQDSRTAHLPHRLATSEATRPRHQHAE